MRNKLDQQTPLKKALILLIGCLAAAIVLFGVLMVAALLIPGNLFPALSRSSGGEELKDWLLAQDALPPQMMLVEQHEVTNQNVADSYPDSKQMLPVVQSWGREDGYSQTYLPQDRCSSGGLHSIGLSVISHKDSVGAQQQLDWSQSRDKADANLLDQVEIGNDGYEFWQTIDSQCLPGDKDQQVSIFFRRNSAGGVVVVSGKKGEANIIEIQQTAERLANLLDVRLQQVTSGN
jgi:hypothetical protein